MSHHTTGIPDPTKGRTEEPHITSIWGTIWLDEEKNTTAKFSFKICNLKIYHVEINLLNIYTHEWDIKISDPARFDEDFKNLLDGYGIQFEEINY